MIIMLLGFTGNAVAEPDIYVGGGIGFTSFNGGISGTIDGSSTVNYNGLNYENIENFS